MPLLRAKELGQIVDRRRSRSPSATTADGRTDQDGGDLALPHARRRFSELKALAAQAPATFTAVDTARDDVCLFGFTSGTTGEPKCTMHFHRDLLAICDAYARNVLKPTPDDRFIGSPPLAFTFGLGGLVLFPFRVGASTVLLEKASPGDLLPAIATYKPTICFTAPPPTAP